MKIAPFKVERWMDEYEGFARYNLGETCVDSLRTEELFAIAGKDPQEFLRELLDLRLQYGYIWGSPALRQGIASLYENIDPDTQVVVTHGGAGANYAAWMALTEPGDNVVTVLPTYQQHYSIPECIGAEVRQLTASREQGFRPDLSRLEELVDEKTKVISICTPANPTGVALSREDMERIAETARKAGAYVMSDEVYRSPGDMPSIADVYEKGVATGSMSKVFGLAGLRLGWLVTRDKEAFDALMNRRDYDLISVGAVDDMLAALALANKDKLLARNRAIMSRGREVLDAWINRTEGFSYVKPDFGTTALVFYDAEVPSFEFCRHLIMDKGVLTTPGSAFEQEHCFRIGYAFSPDLLEEGLAIIGETLKEYQ